jgi:erythronate-4-phosphate dehydrogenase
MMKIVCSDNMPFAEEAFQTIGRPVIRPGRSIGPADVADAELLAIRSTTRIDRRLLDGSPVRFVGTATIGIDHMDTQYMDSQNIRWCYAPGCNANSVSEYVVSALLKTATTHGMSLAGMTLGIVGVGNVGTRVAGKAEALDMRVLLNDPPRERTDISEGRPAFVPLDELLAKSDIVTLHVPLTRAGPDQTFHMADARFFSKIRKGAVFLNTARGEVVDSWALMTALRRDHVAAAIIDTWENEPLYKQDLLDAIRIGTPHIAGHSFDGKVEGTMAVYRQTCGFLGIDPAWTPHAVMPSPPVPEISFDCSSLTEQQALWAVVREVYDVSEDDRMFRAIDGSSPDARGRHFDTLRANYPMRREFHNTTVTLKNGSNALRNKLGLLGFLTSMASDLAPPASEQSPRPAS